MPQTIEISSAVGTTWKTTDERRNEMPLQVVARQLAVASEGGKDRERRTHLVPRSIALVRPPVCLRRWNPMSRLRR